MTPGANNCCNEHERVALRTGTRRFKRGDAAGTNSVESARPMINEWHRVERA